MAITVKIRRLDVRSGDTSGQLANARGNVAGKTAPRLTQLREQRTNRVLT